MARTVALIGAPTSAGAFAPGQEKAPAALRAAGLVGRLTEAGVAVVDHGDGAVWRWRPDALNRSAQNLGAVVGQARSVADRVRSAGASGEVPLVLGGDCTVEIGTITGALATGERLGLVYVDLHPDLNVPRSVASGTLDWMGMAHILGETEAEPTLAGFGSREPLMAGEDVRFFGYGWDHFTDWEREVFRRRQLRGVAEEAVAADPASAARRVAAELGSRCERLLVHFDVDVIDFVDAPLSENTRRSGGLGFDQVFAALEVFLADPRFGGLTITELNPDHGAADGSTVERFVAALVGVFGGAMGARDE